MTSENIGEREDLQLTDEDAESVVGGLKKKKAKKVAAKKTPVKTIQAAAAVTPVVPMTQAQMDAYDKDMIEHGLDPVYGTTATETTATE